MSVDAGTADPRQLRRRKDHREVKSDDESDFEILYQQSRDNKESPRQLPVDQQVTSSHAGGALQDRDDCQPNDPDDIPERIQRILFDKIKPEEEWRLEAENKRNEFINNLKKLARTLNFMMIGVPGVGKTSFLNTIAAAIYGSFNESFEIGGGHNSAVSTKITKADKCGLQRILTARAGKDFEELGRMTKETPLPSYIDVPGLPQQDQTSEVFKEVLRALISGRVKDGEKIIGPGGLLSMQAEEIKEKYPYGGAKKEMEPDVVFIITSATSPLPEVMLKDIMSVLQPTESEGFTHYRVCGVMTKIDEVTDWNAYRQKREKFISLLNLRGKEYALLELQNYVNVRPGSSRPRLDVNVLDFLEYSISPGMDRVAHGRDDVTEKAREEQPHIKAYRAAQRDPKLSALLICGVVVHVVACVLFLVGVPIVGVAIIVPLIILLFLALQYRLDQQR